MIFLCQKVPMNTSMHLAQSRSENPSASDRRGVRCDMRHRVLSLFVVILRRLPVRPPASFVVNA